MLTIIKFNDNLYFYLNKKISRIKTDYLKKFKLIDNLNKDLSSPLNKIDLRKELNLMEKDYSTIKTNIYNNF